ncbi:MAG: Maf family protein [Chloroflexi bacterium]|nr:Maf family protein [Chloroflexota bacterium]
MKRYNRRMGSEPIIVLASGSQRRRDIIGALDVSVEIVPSGIEERSPGLTERPEEYVASIAADKADAVSANGHSGTLVIGADTSVVLDERIFGKPENDIEARVMLTALRGRSHRVVTGVTAMHNDTSASSVTSSEVTVREYSDGEMEAYIESGEPFDKAGGYAIQDEWFAPVSAISGCYLNVVGFPLCEVIRLLSDVGVDVRLKPQWRPPERCPTDCPVRVVSEATFS